MSKIDIKSGSNNDEMTEPTYCPGRRTRTSRKTMAGPTLSFMALNSPSRSSSWFTTSMDGPMLLTNKQQSEPTTCLRPS